ncbi:MAG TPA: TIM barrel protein [Pseudolabrys sp.]|nr:TIM barrel protein [Pseudolabrys sp.]
MPRFAANLGYLFTEHPMLDRVGAAAAAGFRAIELQFPYEVPASRMKAAIDANRLTVLGINTLRGEGDEFGLAAVPGREREWETMFERALDYISAIGGSAVHCLAGKVDPSQRPAAERVFISNLSRAADLAAEKNIALLIEPINPGDRPNYFLNHLEHAADIIAKVGKSNVRIQFDFYHMQIVGGDLIRRFARFQPLIGHLQCSAVPSRQEPDEGEVNFRAVFEAIDRLGWTGWIGAEYRPRGRTEEGLGWARPYGVVAKD